MNFNGIDGVVVTEADTVRSVYLGIAIRLRLGEINVESASGNPVRAVLTRTPEGFRYAADAKINLTLPPTNGPKTVRLPAANNSAVA